MAPKEAKPPKDSGNAVSTPQQDDGMSWMPQGLRDMGTSTFLIVMAAITSRISQLSLAPVYGSIPSSVNHQAAIAASALIGWTTQWYWRPSGGAPVQYLPIWAACTPALTCLSFQFSDSLGLVWGPVVGGFLSCHSLVIPLVYAAAASYDGPDVKQSSSGPLAHLFSSVPSLGLFLALDWMTPEVVSKFIATWPFLNPFNAQLIVALYLALMLTERRAIAVATVSIAAVLALVSPYGNSPISNAVLNNALNSQDYTLLARQWSNTGYLSVLENTNANYRVMRCDHSLLGGEWQLTPQRRNQGWKISESIYAAFHMLEAVRLMEVEPPIPDSEAQALIIGLGIGTAPKAFIEHGINTTIVELDPVVHQLAIDYFSLPTKHTPVLTDAIAWVHSQVHSSLPEEHSDESESNAAPDPIPAPEMKQYDYIIHDVFTGGAEPLPLFTTSFLASLRSLLKPNGVAALNYAGDLTLPLTAKVLNTIDRAFGGNCALYRDSAPPKSSSPSEPLDTFANYIVFCRNAPGPVAFRQPTAADFLDSISRRQHLYPRPEFAVDFPLRGKEGAEKEVLRDEEVGEWKREQEESARRHWGIMRVVMPGRIWGLY